MPFDSKNLKFYNDNSLLVVKIYQFFCYIRPYETSPVYKKRKSLLDFIKIFNFYFKYEEIAGLLGIEKELINRHIKYKYDYKISKR